MGKSIDSDKILQELSDRWYYVINKQLEATIISAHCTKLKTDFQFNFLFDARICLLEQMKNEYGVGE